MADVAFHRRNAAITEPCCKGLEHETGILGQGHARQQIVHAGFDRQAEVFVGVELTVVIEVAESEILVKFSSTQGLLRTKLFVPLVPEEPIPRTRLMERLQRGVTGKLSLVTAPAGYGKTTLVTTWLYQLPARERQVIWLSLDDGDNDARRFFTYVVAALTQLDPAFDVIREEFLQAAHDELPTTTLVTNLLNQVVAHGESVILVLDDYHQITQQSIHDAVTFWLDHQPPNMHLVITSRAEPPMPLSRLRVRRQVTEIDAEALRFTRAESAAFLNQHMHLNLPEDDIAQLDSVTEGWVAGLQLAALSLQHKDDPTAFIQTFKGDNRYIVDYLVTEVLDRQPGYIRDFLLQTSILERLNVQLCNAVTGQVGGQHILETLDQSRLFVIPLDDRRHWYRYHHLFADCLRAELLRTMPTEAATYHERASHWLSEHGFADEAIHHAFAVHNHALVADLIAANAHTLLWERGETRRPWQWIQQLPHEAVQTRPQLLITTAWLHQELFLDHSSRVTDLLNSATALIDAGDAPYSPSEIADMATEIALAHSNLERLRGNLAQALQYATRASTLTQAGKSSLLRSSVHHSLALTHHQVGNVVASLEHSDVRFPPHRADEPLDYGHYVSLAYRIDAMRLAGQLHRAERAFQRVDPQHLQRRHSGAAMVAISWAEVLRERNELSRAVAYLTPALEQLKPQQSMSVVVQTGVITLARIYQAQGQGQAGIELLQEALQTHRASDMYYPSARISAIEALLHLQQGNLTTARTWAEKSGLRAVDTPVYLLEIDYLVLARLLIADGDGRAAHALLERLENATTEGGRTARLIEVQILQALVHQASGKSERALEQLRKAIALAQPAGFVRVFVDEGESLAPLLKQVAGRGMAVGYIRQLLSLIDERHSALIAETSPNARPTAEVAMPETDFNGANLLLNPLTDRELATLRYLATDLTISEIAEQMVVAPSTIRTYVKRIYGKLDVHTRIEAVNRARLLALLV